jgi:hypothetical protein
MGGESLLTSTEVQSAGEAYRLSRKVMKGANSCFGGQHLALLYTQALIVQTRRWQYAISNYLVEQQFCRWILMTVDRLQSDKIVITQEQISFC